MALGEGRGRFRFWRRPRPPVRVLWPSVSRGARSLDRPDGRQARGRSVTIRQVAIESRSIAKTQPKPRSKRTSGQPCFG